MKCIGLLQRATKNINLISLRCANLAAVILCWPKSTNSLPQFRNYKIIYRRYAGLFFCVCVDVNDNELAYLEAIHLFVEILGAFGLSRPGLSRWLIQKTDAFFDNVCELDLVFNFYKVRRDLLTIRTDADPVADIRFMPFWTKYFWQERLKRRAKMWSCPDWRLWRSWSDIVAYLCTPRMFCLSSLALILWFTALFLPTRLPSPLFNSRVLTYVRRSPRADANNLCFARSQIRFLLTCIL